MNKQRTAVYGLRRQLLEGLDQKELILEDYVANLLSAVMEAACAGGDASRSVGRERAQGTAGFAVRH